MKQIILVACVAVFLGTRSSDGQEPVKPSDTPTEVLQFLDNATGSWYAKLGGASCACTVNSRASGRCVLLEGRRFADAISCTALFGWYAPSRQVIGLIVFENGESLIVRARVRAASDRFTLEGNAVGILGGEPFSGTYKSTSRENAWTIEVTTADGEIIKGHVQSTGSR
jgi:hypothetical protein